MIGIEINRTKSNEQSCQNLKIKCHTKKEKIIQIKWIIYTCHEMKQNHEQSYLITAFKS